MNDRVPLAAGSLLAATMFLMLLPNRMNRGSTLQVLVCNGGHAITWLTVLGFLVWYAHRQTRSAALQRSPRRCLLHAPDFER